MKSQNKLAALVAVLLLFASSSMAKDGPGGKRQQRLNMASGLPAYALMNANNITSWLHDDGFYNWLIAGSWNGEFPKGSGVGFVFSEGIVIGGKVNDGLGTDPRVEGDTYGVGMQPGIIRVDANGKSLGPEDPNGADVRIWAVRPDVRPGQPSSQIPDLTSDAATFFQKAPASVTSADINQVLQQYYTDWKQWPAYKGAPWYVDTVGVVRYDNAYDPNNPHHIPGIPGATKTAWYVCNDLNPSLTTQFYGAQPIGIEEQVTTWAYASSTPLNNIIFKQVRVIYKGYPTTPAGASIDSMYIVQWADEDVGDAGDDYAGSDSTLSLGYQYNSTTIDAKYAAVGLPAPAGGYVFLQGASHYTGNPADSAVIGLQWRHGYAYWSSNPLSAFDYFAAGSPISDPDFATIQGSYQWFNLMRGMLPRPAWPSGTPFYTSSAYASSHGIVTNYALSGDPITKQGWIDGIDIQAGDRRIVNVSGPFHLNLHDTAEVVVAEVGGMGADNISSVAVLKYNSTYAHFAYNNLFKLPAPPPGPQVKLTNLSNEVILNWAGNEQAVTATETSDNAGFKFEGYNVYQLPSPSASIKDGVRIATYDVVDNVTVIVAPEFDAQAGVLVDKPVEFGSDNGIKRFIDLKTDYINQRPLVNGQSYYYAVTAYSYNPDWNNPNSIYKAPFPSLESSPVILIATPQAPVPGVRYGSSFGDTLKATHNSGKSDGTVLPIVVDPTSTTGHQYQVTFQTDQTTGNTTWSLTDKTTNKPVLSGQTNQSGDANYLVTDGIQVKVVGPPPGAKDWNWISGTRKLTWANADGFGLEDFNGAFGWASPYGIFNSGNVHSDSVTASMLANIEIVFANTDKNGVLTNSNDPNASYGYRYLRNAQKAPANPAFAPFIIHTAKTYDWQDYTLSVPLAVYNIEDPAHPKRLAVGYLENNASGGLVDGHYWPPYYNSADNVSDANGPREWLFIFNKPYTGSTPDPELEQNILYNDLPVMYMATWARRDTTHGFSSQDTLVIDANHVNTPADIFSFTAPAVTQSVSLAQSDVDKINVFPNPYYGLNAMETNRLDKYVTFSHLPTSTDVVIRIFNLAGVLVRTIRHTNGTQFDTWNLRNDANLPVASGIYVVYVDMPTLGKTKILKLALVQEQQILPTY